MHLSRVYRIVLIVVAFTLTACTAGERLLPSPVVLTPTPLPPEPTIEQPSYIVQRGDVIRELDFTARVTAEQEARLFFRADGYLSRLIVQRTVSRLRQKVGEACIENVWGQGYRLG